jgi:Na+-translocating ferredoxin:NAD+ oxidoreductase RnfE subunit
MQSETLLYALLGVCPLLWVSKTSQESELSNMQSETLLYALLGVCPLLWVSKTSQEKKCV